jgi:hypothetical protein
MFIPRHTTRAKTMEDLHTHSSSLQNLIYSAL